MDLISVIVPVYKVEQYLNRCVNSILQQTYRNIEIILIDDGSPDNCPQMCDELAVQNKNIKVVHKENGGLSSARNTGLDICKGKYISFIDSDDFIDNNFIKCLYDLIVKYEASIAMLNYAEVKNDKNLPRIKTKKEIFYQGKDVEKAFFKLKIDSVCVGLYNRDIIGLHRFIEGKTSEDIPFNFEMFRKAKSFVYLPEKRYFYYYNSESISNGVLDKDMLNYLEFRKNISDYYTDKDNELRCIAKALYARAAFGLQCRMSFYGIAKELDEEECRRMFLSAFKSNKKEFYKESSIPKTRKIMAFLIFNFDSAVRLLRGIKK